MSRKQILFAILLIGFGSAAFLVSQANQCGPNCPMHKGGGQHHMGSGGPGMHAGDPVHAEDMEAIHFLLDNGDRVQRTVEKIPNGVRTQTESDDPEIVAVLRRHVTAMYGRIEENRPIHQRDPLFAELFKHAAEIEMKWEETDRGVVVTETSSNPEVAALIQAHADVVSKFIENGRSEAMKNHPVP